MQKIGEFEKQEHKNKEPLSRGKSFVVCILFNENEDEDYKAAAKRRGNGDWNNGRRARLLAFTVSENTLSLSRPLPSFLFLFFFNFSYQLRHREVLAFCSVLIDLSFSPLAAAHASNLCPRHSFSRSTAPLMGRAWEEERRDLELLSNHSPNLDRSIFIRSKGCWKLISKQCLHFLLHCSEIIY